MKKQINNKSVCEIIRNDVDVSEKLSLYGKTAAAFTYIGMLCILLGAVFAITVHEVRLKAILITACFLIGICFAGFLGDGMRKKQKKLIRESFDAYFAEKYEEKFGDDIHTDRMKIDSVLIKNLRIHDGEWEELFIDNYHEGVYRKIHFSAANVCLNHVYECGNIHDGRIVERKSVFDGLIIRYESENPIEVLPDDFARAVDGETVSLHFADGINSVAVETKFRFAAPSEGKDFSRAEDVKKSYEKSLSDMEALLDALK